MIERLYVHNYRCFENFTLDLKGKPSALVIGKNGSGKSTLRHALGVLQEACRQAVEWQKAGYPSRRMAINLSARQLADKGFVELLVQILK